MSQLLSSDVAVADLNIVAQVGAGNLGVFDIDDVELEVNESCGPDVNDYDDIVMKVTLKRTSRADRVHVAAQRICCFHFWCWAMLRNDCQAAMTKMQNACSIADRQHSGFVSSMGGIMHMMCVLTGAGQHSGITVRLP